MSDEEKKAIEILKLRLENASLYVRGNNEVFYNALGIVLKLIEKQSKEIKELSDKYTEKICKGVEEEILEEYRREIKELKEDRKKYAEEYIHNNPWLYKQLNENYILRVESEQRERGAYIKGTNDADELCNKKWEDKIKAKIEEIDYKMIAHQDVREAVKQVLQSLLEKE